MPYIIATGDCNGDGLPDLVCGANVNSFLPNTDEFLVLLLSTEQGYIRQSLTDARGIMGVAVADFNNDGRDDVATFASQGLTVRVYLQAQDGSLSDPLHISLLSNPNQSLFQPESSWLEAADLDGDGSAELIVSGYLESAPFKYSSLAVVRLDAGGTLTASYGGDEQPREYLDRVLVDLDLDGDLDLILGLATGAQRCEFDGVRFGPRQPLQTAGTGGRFAWTDADGDGSVDLVRMLDGSIEVEFLGGAPRPLQTVSFQFNSWVEARGIKDVTADGAGDLLLFFAERWLVVSDLLDNPSAAASGPIVDRGIFGFTPVATDTSWDGRMELVVVSRGRAATYPLDHRKAGFERLGTECLDLPEHTNTTIADLNSDGMDDVIMGASSRGYVSLRQPDGSLAPWEEITASGGFALDGDLDGDGRPDLVWINGTGRMRIYFNSADGFDFSTPLVYEIGTPSGIIANGMIMDVDGDGTDEIVAGLTVPNRVVVFGGGGRGLPTVLQSVSIGSRPLTFEPIDFNHDGLQDVATVGQDGVFRLLALTEDGILSAPLDVASGTPGGLSMRFDVADLDADGFEDLVAVRNSSSLTATNTFVVLWGSSSGFEPPQVSGLAPHLRQIVLIDFDQDGLMEAAVAQEDTSHAEGSVWMVGQSTPRQFDRVTEMDGWSTESIVDTDWNRDGRVDLLVSGLVMQCGLRVLYGPDVRCPADFAPPWDTLNFFDLTQFLSGYAQQESPADMAPPFGVWDFFDLSAFLMNYMVGCE